MSVTKFNLIEPRNLSLTLKGSVSPSCTSIPSRYTHKTPTISYKVIGETTAARTPFISADMT